MELWLVVIPAILSVGGAVYSAWSASKARASEVEAMRLRELERRLSDRKIGLYEEILTAMGNLLVPKDALAASGGKPKPGQHLPADPLMKAVVGFMNHVIVYGSDDVVHAFSRFRLAASADPPAVILMRLVADFMLAIRRDLNGGTTSLTALDMIAMRINDLYAEPEITQALASPFGDVCKAHGWTPPWETEIPALTVKTPA